MNTQEKLARIKKMGGGPTTVRDLLDLTDADQAYIDMRLAMSRMVQEARKKLGWNQTQLAHRVGSEQSRIAKVEKADPSVSFDLLIRSLLALQLAPSDIASGLMEIKSTAGVPVRSRSRRKAAGKKTAKRKTAKKAVARRR